MRLARRALMSLLLSAWLCSLTACDPPHGSRVVVGAKNFTEQVLLGELLAQQIEAQGEKVDRRFYLAGSYIAHQALLSGRIDTYVEYSGTAMSSIFKRPVDRDAARVRAVITRLYLRNGIRVMPALGFQNTFAMVMRSDEAQRLHVATLSDLHTAAPQLQLGTGYEFEERPDGLHGMEQVYQLNFAGAPRVMDLGLLYRALANRQVDIVAGNSTDGAVATMHLQVLADDRHYFPPYEALPLVREETLRTHPAVGRALDQLAGKCSERDMQAMNHAVEGEHRDPADVVREFRQRAGL